MPSCVNCNRKLLWIEVFKQTMLVKRDPLRCPNCKQQLFFTAKSKKKLFLVTAIVPILFVILTSFQIPTTISVITLIVYALLVVLAVPFLVEVTNKEEALFWMLMAIKNCSVWQLSVCINYCISSALHGVAGMIGLYARHSPVACPLCQKACPQRLHVKRQKVCNFIQIIEYPYLPFHTFFNCQKQFWIQ
jgi:CXXC-20-CXXC protein